MTQGNLAIVLHAHLPYVRHPEYDRFFEENWFFEALTESYIPLVAMLDRLQDENIEYRLTLSLSPTLMTLLQDDLLHQRYLEHMRRLIELADKEIVRTEGCPEFQPLARWYHSLFESTLAVYRDRYRGDLLSAFRRHRAAGRLEVITSAATHAFLPLLNTNPRAVKCQIDTGVETFRSVFGSGPDGFWLPECGYYPGLEAILKEAGVDYFFVDSHGIDDASEPPRHGVYAPLDCGNGVCAFGRDPQSSQSVWSAEKGYPGHADYREFHRDIGFELDWEAIAPYMLEDGSRINTGIKYHRVTGPGDDKAPYLPDVAAERARRHAADFMQKKRRQIEALASAEECPPLIVAPFDAELFGHWWFEGPQWLEETLRLAAADERIRLQTAGDYLAGCPSRQQALPAASSWGEEGYASYWLNESNDWIYPLLHRSAAEMECLADDLGGCQLDDLQERAANQALRSLLLAQASDWPFILKSGTDVDYARKRIGDHLARFNYLLDCIRKNRIDERYLAALEIMDDIFPTLDFRTYCNPSSRSL